MINDYRFSGRVALVNRVQALDHMMGTYSPEVDTLGVITVAAAPITPNFASQFARLRRNTDVSDEIAPFRRLFSDLP